MQILHSNATSESAARLGKVLNCKTARSVWDKQDFLIRWGCSTPVTHKPEKVLNSRQSILASVDKLKMMQHFRKFGVPIPRFWEHAQKLTFPCIFRTRCHTRGEGFHVVKTLKAARALKKLYDGYFVQLIQKRDEYRMFVVKNKIILLYVRRKSKKRVDSRLIRNDDNGWKLTLCKTLPSIAVAQAAIKATQALKLNFCAVDLAIDKYRRPFVFEVNTGPELTTFRAKHVGDALIRTFKLPVTQAASEDD